MPRFEYKIIKDRIYELLEPELLDEDRKYLFKYFYEKNWFRLGGDGKEQYEKHLLTLRDVTRFCNSFLLSYELLKGEIIFLELFNLEILKIKYLQIYNEIFSNSKKYLEMSKSGKDHGKFIYKLSKVKKEKESNNSLDKINFKDSEDEIIYKIEQDLMDSKLFPSLMKVKNITRLLESIFPSVKYFELEDSLSIIYPSSFYRYSFYRLLDSDLSYVDFSKSRKEDSIHDFCNNISIWVDNGFRESLKEIFEFEKYYDDKEDCEKIIKGILHFLNISYDVNTIYLMIGSGGLLSKLMYERNDSIKNIFPKKDIFRKFVTDIFVNAHSPFFIESSILAYGSNEFGNEFIIPKKTLTEIQLDYFKKYLKLDLPISSLTMRLFYNSKIYTEERREEELRNPEAIKDLKIYLVKYIESFVNYIVIKNIVGLYEIDKIILDLFKSMDEFEVYIDIYDDSKHTNLKEFKLFLIKYKDNEYNGTKFIFKKMKPRK